MKRSFYAHIWIAQFGKILIENIDLNGFFGLISFCLLLFLFFFLFRLYWFRPINIYLKWAHLRLSTSEKVLCVLVCFEVEGLKGFLLRYFRLCYRSVNFLPILISRSIAFLNCCFASGAKLGVASV